MDQTTIDMNKLRITQIGHQQSQGGAQGATPVAQGDNTQAPPAPEPPPSSMTHDDDEDTKRAIAEYKAKLTEAEKDFNRRRQATNENLRRQANTNPWNDMDGSRTILHIEWT